jgi:two-component system sensor histidine kinase YesM
VYPFETVYDPTGLQVIQDKKGYYIDNIEGKKALVAYSAFDYTGWTFVHIVPFDKIFERISWMKLIMIALYAAIFVAAIYLGTQFSKSITSPIENLTSRMKVVEKGIFEPDDIPQFKHHDEISRLSRDFEKMIDKIHILVQENYLKQLVIKETEYKALQSKINPHFLYNTLESINWVAIVNGQDHISRMVKSLGDLLRNSIGAQEYVTVKEELDMLDNYLFIQTFRYEERLSVTLNIEERFLDYTIPKLIIQPIVENAIHYGVEGLTGTCRIIITAGVDRNLFFLQVSDTGQGMENDYLEQMETGNVKPKGTGMGLKNIDERLKLIYGNDYGVRIESSDQGTSVLILMPILAAKEMQHVQSDVS